MYVSSTIITVFITLLGALIAYSSYKRLYLKDIQADIRESTKISTKLDMVLQIVSILQSKVDIFDERITRVEESTKQAHKRIDEIIK